MVGLSLSRCIADLVLNNAPVAEDQVKKIYSQLIVKNEHYLEYVIDRYSRSHWQSLLPTASQMAKRFFDNNKIISPRLISDGHYPITVTGYWVEKESDIWWADRPETTHGPTFKSPPWAFGLRTETPHSYLEWSGERNIYPIISLKRPDWFVRQDFQTWLATLSSDSKESIIYVEYNKYAINGNLVELNRNIPKDIMKEIELICIEKGYNICLVRIDKY